MNSCIYHFALIISLLVPMTSRAADIVLRQRATQHGAIVRLGDIADIAAESTIELNGLASTPLLPAPAAGTQQFLNAAQVRDLLVARGVRLSTLTFRGASIVELGSASLVSKDEIESPPQSDTEIEASVQLAISNWLRSKVSNGRWRVETALNDRLRSEVAELGSISQVRGPRLPRSGRQRFFLINAANNKELLVTAEITQIQSVVVARQPIERGSIVRSSDLELQEREGNLPRGTIGDLHSVLGKVAERSLRAGEVVQSNQLRAAWQVRRGETVNVFVRTGGVVVRTRAIAKADGAMDDLIEVETLENKKKLSARVAGPGEVIIHATGGHATDYASLNRNDQRRR